MRKRDEIEDHTSCFNKATDAERLFVMLARDPAAPVAIRAWITERIRLGKNKPEDAQILEAHACANLMEVERTAIESTRRQESTRWTEGAAMNVVFMKFASIRDNNPSCEEMDWTDFVTLLSEPLMATCTLASCLLSTCPHKRVAAWSPAMLASAVISMLVFDVEHATDAQIYEIRGRIDGYRHLIHATHSDRPDSRCVRIIIALSRPVQRALWGTFWQVAQQMIAPIADAACADASRIYFLPSVPRDAGYFIQVNEGAPLDVDAILAIATAAVQAPCTAEGGFAP